MLLAINANNTNVKFAVYDGERPLGDWRIRTESARTADEYVVWLSQLMTLAGLKLVDITDAIIATVVPQALFNLRMLCERHLRTRPLVVGEPGVSLGVDVLDARGRYLGGVIAPGINLSLEALHGATAKLPRIAVAAPKQVIGKDTLGAMQSGVYWGYVGLIEGLVARIRAEFGEQLMVVATGGLAPLFAKATPVIERHEPEITMRGLVEIHRRNQGAPR